MKKCKITVMRIACYQDLMEKYENPMEHACDMKEGQVFIANGWEKPKGMCDSAWESISPFVMTLSHGGSNLYNGWMKNEKSAMEWLIKAAMKGDEGAILILKEDYDYTLK